MFSECVQLLSAITISAPDKCPLLHWRQRINLVVCKPLDCGKNPARCAIGPPGKKGDFFLAHLWLLQPKPMIVDEPVIYATAFLLPRLLEMLHGSEDCFSSSTEALRHRSLWGSEAAHPTKLLQSCSPRRSNTPGFQTDPLTPPEWSELYLLCSFDVKTWHFPGPATMYA